MSINKRTWNTYAIAGYTGDGQDQRAAGGVRMYSVRLSSGGWQQRVANSNGRYTEVLDVEAVDDATGEALYARAEFY